MRLAYLLLMAMPLAFNTASFAQKMASNKMTNQKNQRDSAFKPLSLCKDYSRSYNPLVPASFNRMMAQDFSYAILGSKNPVSGFKIETSTPSVTLSANAYSNNDRTFLISLQASASTQSNLSEIFSQQKLTGTFSGSIGFNFLLNDFQKGIYRIKPDDKRLKHFVIGNYADKLSAKLDTSLVYCAISQAVFTNLKSFDDLVNNVMALQKNYEDLKSLCPMPKDSIAKIARSILNKYGKFTLSDDKLLDGFKQGLKNGKLDNADRLHKDLEDAKPYATDSCDISNGILARSKSCCYAQMLTDLDTTLVYTVIGQDDFPNINNFDDFVDAVAKLRSTYVQCHVLLPSDRKQIENMVRAVFHKFGKFPIANDDLLAIFQDDLPNNRLDNMPQLDKALSEARSYDKDLQKNATTIINQVNDSCISIFKDIWVKKRLWWISVSPTVSNGSITFYDTINKKTSDTNTLVYGLQFSLNLLQKYKQNFRFLYGKLGVDLGQVSNVPDLSKFSYQNSNTLNSAGTSILTSQKTGTAYKGSLRNSFGWDVFFEFYADLWHQQAIPGFYLKPEYSYGSTSINKNKFSLEVGIIWNLANSDKTKNVISIVPFISWSNFLKNYTNQTIPQLFSVGLKFGIPINLGN